MGGFSQYAQKQDEGSRLRPVIIAVVCVLVIGVIAYLASRGRTGPAAQPSVAPYAVNLQTGDLHLSTAQNFVGGQVTYLEGKVTNTGNQSVTGAQVDTIFRNTLGEIVDRQTQPLRVSVTPLGNPDWVSLSTAPLAPAKSAEFRLTFEHISADWNMGYPELKFVSVQTK